MTTKKVFRSVIFSAVSRKFQAAAFLILLMAGGRLLSAQALLQAGIASVTGTSPDLTLDLKMTMQATSQRSASLSERSRSKC
jgi:hypothetical protein